MDYGTDLGAEFQTGLSENASWSLTDPPTAAQDGTWQAGASILSSGIGYQGVNVYPNPASDHINISILEPAVVFNYIRIINLSGEVVFDRNVDPDLRQFHIRVNLPPGFYFAQMGLNNRPRFTKKLVIRN